jgi:transposase-like protein
MFISQTIHFLFSCKEAARLHIERVRWNGAPLCPKCQALKKQYRQTRKGAAGYYVCGVCKKVYSVRTGTIFECSQVPLNKWLFAIHCVITARKGISSFLLSKKLGVTQKTAWFMLKRIRQTLEDDSSREFMKSLAEVGETHPDGLETNRIGEPDEK